MITKPLILLFIAILTATPLFSQQQEEPVPADGAGQLEGGLEVVDSVQTDQTPLPPQPETSLFAEGVVEAAEETSTPSSTTTATTFPQFVFQPPAPMSMEEFIATRSNFCVSFDEGATASWNTRLIKQSGRTWQGCISRSVPTTLTPSFPSPFQWSCSPVWRPTIP